MELVQCSGNKIGIHEIDAQTTIVTPDCRKVLIGLHICLNLKIIDLNMQLVMQKDLFVFDKVVGGNW
jgi:hypothetical protein